MVISFTGIQVVSVVKGPSCCETLPTVPEKSPKPGPRRWACQNRCMSGRLRWLVCLGVAACVGVQVVALAVDWRWYTSQGPHLGGVLAVLDGSVADTLAAAGDDAAVAVDGLVRVRSCGLRPLRTGGIYSRGVEFYLDPGSEDALIGTIARQLPVADHPQRSASASGGAAQLTATMPHGVTLQVHQLGDGWVVATASTGCVTGPSLPVDPTAPTATPAATAIDGLLAGLGSRPASLHQIDLACPGGRAVTVAAVSQATSGDRLPQRVVVPAGARRYSVASANRVAYRAGGASVIVAATDDGTAVTVEYTTGC
jgi:hypothetical protein